MATDYGTDLSCITDLSPLMAESSGRMVLIEAALRRVTTGRGMVIDSPNDGVDLNEALSDDMTTLERARIRALVESELVKDERIFSATVTRNDYDVHTKTLRMSIRLIDADGPFSLTLAINSVSVQLLEVT
jgi:hypothetical protein